MLGKEFEIVVNKESEEMSPQGRLNVAMKIYAFVKGVERHSGKVEDDLRKGIVYLITGTDTTKQ